MSAGNQRVLGFKESVQSSLARKQIPLCKEHHVAMQAGKISKSDLKPGF